MGCTASSDRSQPEDSIDSPWATPAQFRPHFPSAVSLSSASLADISMLVCESSHTRGGRSYMEDFDILHERYILASDPDVYISAYGVFDGHGGSECAAYVSRFLPLNIFKALTLNTTAGGHHMSTARIIYNCYMETDANWMTTNSTSNAGSTCTLFIWRTDENRGYVSSVGDSRAVLCRGGEAVDMTHDHKPSDESISELIVKNGGYVENDRINGTLGERTAYIVCSIFAV
jgi:serine/threonine protein phosphatase PrpC